MRVIAPIILLGIFILNWLVGIHLGFGIGRYWFFEVLHFAGGFFVAMFLASFAESYKRMFGGLAVITFLWELAEYAADKIPSISSYFKVRLELESTNLVLGDTALDIILNFAGALFFIMVFKKKTQ